MLNALLHHLGDDHAARLLFDVLNCLATGGALFTLDGCLREGQHPFAHWMHTHDRREYVRDEAGYRRLLEGVFPSVEIQFREDLSWVPHTYCTTVCRLQSVSEAVRVETVQAHPLEWLLEDFLHGVGARPMRARQANRRKLLL